jgi:hypothetical protein
VRKNACESSSRSVPWPLLTLKGMEEQQISADDLRYFAFWEIKSRRKGP